MIQRIQSLYWLGSIICLSFLNFGLDVFKFETKNAVYEFDFYSCLKLENGKLISEKSQWIYPASMLITVLIIVAIFLHKKIKTQLNLSNRITFGITFLFIIITINAYSGAFVDNPKSVIFAPGYYLMFISIVFSYLASWSVKKDKNLLDSVDRIR
jgi:hypothetical protein